MPASSLRTGFFSERFKEVIDFRVAPIGSADEAAANPAAAIDDECLGPSSDGIFIAGRLLWVADGDEVHMALLDKLFIIAGVRVGTDCQDRDIGVLVVELQQRGQLCDTGWAMRLPEVNDDDSAAIVGQMNRCTAIGDAEIRRRLVDLHGVTAPVAAGRNESQSQRGEDGSARIKEAYAHIPIIRSGSRQHHGGSTRRSYEGIFTARFKWDGADGHRSSAQ
jgi:hypothetical protein